METTTSVNAGQQFLKPPMGGFPLLAKVAHVERPAAVERLPFSVRIVGNEQDLEKAVRVRHSAYGRHIPAVAAMLEKPEASDHEPGSIVLLAESKLDGAPLGTMRIQTNRYRKLALEQSVDLPSWLQGTRQAEATRLGVALGRTGRLVKTALFKAYYEYCVMEEIEWMVIAARSPLDRQYEALLFEDVIPGGDFVPMRHAGNIPHRVLAFNIELAERNWRQAGHPLYSFVFETIHPDIGPRGTGSLPLADSRLPLANSARGN
jgi:hypothetical protein